MRYIKRPVTHNVGLGLHNNGIFSHEAPCHGGACFRDRDGTEQNTRRRFRYQRFAAHLAFGVVSKGGILTYLVSPSTMINKSTNKTSINIIQMVAFDTTSRDRRVTLGELTGLVVVLVLVFSFTTLGRVLSGGMHRVTVPGKILLIEGGRHITEIGGKRSTLIIVRFWVELYHSSRVIVSSPGDTRVPPTRFTVGPGYSHILSLVMQANRRVQKQVKVRDAVAENFTSVKILSLRFRGKNP